MTKTPKEIVESIVPFEYSQYKDISSYEKLAVFAACFLEDQGITLSFNYICIAAFKFFPDKFCCDEDFKEYPSVDRLNRTVMHMTIVSSGSPLLNGSAKEGYHLTKYGRMIGDQVKQQIYNAKKDPTITAPTVDMHKSSGLTDYKKFRDQPGFQIFCKTGKVELSYIWELYGIIPFTQISMVKEKLRSIKTRAVQERDEQCANYAEKVFEKLK